MYTGTLTHHLLLKKDKQWSESEIMALEKIVVGHFERIFAERAHPKLVWRGTKRDLVELSHWVWELGVLRDARGCMLDFKTIVYRIFSVFNLKAPASPSSVFSHVLNRKNVRVCSVAERYLFLIQKHAVKDPMRLDMIVPCEQKKMQ